MPIVIARICDDGIVPTDAVGDKLPENPRAAFNVSIVDKPGAVPREFDQGRFVVEDGAGGRLLADYVGIEASGPGGSEACRFRFADFDDHLEDLSRAWTNEHIVC